MRIWNKIFGDRKNETKQVGDRPLFTIRDSDIFLVSYPKSGNTWVRFLIGNYITNNNFSFVNSNDIIPDMHAHPQKCAEINGLRIIKSHFAYTSEFKNVIYIARDSRDVAVSYYYYYLKYVYNKESIKPSFDEFLTLFMKGEVGYGYWDRHVNSWLDSPTKRFLLLRYEDMIADTVKAMNDILMFIYGEIDESRMKKAIEASTFNRMAETEKKERILIPRHAMSDPSISFVRKGSPGDYQNYFSEEKEGALLGVFGTTMRKLKYI